MKFQSFFALLTLAVLALGGQQAAAQYPMPGGYPGNPYAAAMMPGGGMGMMAPAPYGAAPASYLGGPSVAEAMQAPGAGDVKCGGKGCGACDDCCGCGWCHRVAVFGEFLYLRARDAEVAYAVPVDGPIVPPVTAAPIEVGRVAVVDQDWDPGFRLGFTYVLDEYASITAQYAMLETDRTDSISTAAPFVLRSLVSHPSTLTAGADFLDAQARHYMDYDLVDVDYRGLIDCCDLYQTNFLVGVRYGQLRQKFRSLFSGNGTEQVDTDIDFYSVGLRAGLEGERYSRSRRLLVYGKLHGSLMAGEFRADYQQRMSFDPLVVDTSWKAGRIVPIVDLEVGGGWQSRCGTWRLTAGYVFSGWFNMVKTEDWIASVQRGSFLDMGDTMTFDGLVARLEARF